MGPLVNLYLVCFLKQAKHPSKVCRSLQHLGEVLDELCGGRLRQFSGVKGASNLLVASRE